MNNLAKRRNNWEVIAAFSFGVVFVITILTIAIFRPNPTPFEYTVFRIVIALAAAGVGAILPGFLDVTFRNWLRAGGALALFVIVYFFAPVVPTPTDGPIIEPVSDAKVPADQWLSLLDAEQYQSAYNSMADGFKSKFPYGQFEELVVRERSHLGDVDARTLFSSAPYESPPGSPKGAYRQYVYRTDFASEPKSIYEIVWLFGESEGWRVSGFYTMIKAANGQFVAYDIE